MPATHVIIRGTPFLYSEKAPFVQSGMSLLGALEYDEFEDKVRCHECGEWSKGLGNHVQKKHGIAIADYKAEHGLSPASSICSMATKEKHRQRGLKTYANGIGRPDSKAKMKQSTRDRAGKPQRPRTDEHRNERNRCRTQLLFRLQMLAVEIGRTPTHEDIRHSDVSLKAIEDMFGGTSPALRLIGLEPNTNNRPKSIPANYPTAEELEARRRKWEEEPMPYPEDYFDTGLIGLQQRRQ